MSKWGLDFLKTNEISSDKKATTNKEPISPGV